MILGKSRSVSDPEEKASALLKLTEHIIPGRTQHARAANERELSQTAVLAIDLNEVSAKASACAHINAVNVNHMQPGALSGSLRLMIVNLAEELWAALRWQVPIIFVA